MLSDVEEEGRGGIPMWIYLHINDGLFQEGRESANMDGERATLTGWGGHPTAVKRPGVSAHT